MVKFEPVINVIFIFSLVICVALIHFSIEDRRASKLFLNKLPKNCITNSTTISTGISLNPYIYKCMSDRFQYKPAFSYRLCKDMCISHYSCGVYDYREICNIVLNTNRLFKLSILPIIGLGLLSIILYVTMKNTIMDVFLGILVIFLVIYMEYYKFDNVVLEYFLQYLSYRF